MTTTNRTPELAMVIRRRAETMAASLDPDEHEDYADGQDTAELLRALARLIEGKTFYAAFGAPGDWGSHSEIGNGVRELYESNGKLAHSSVAKSGCAD